MRWLRILFIALAAITASLSAAYYWLIVESHAPSSGEFPLDLAEIRRLADSLPGDKSTEIRVETVGTIYFPRTAVVAGDGWERTSLPVSAYQLVFPDKSVLIDTGYDAATAAKAEAENTGFNEQSYNAIVRAMNSASMILLTHEHWDHAASLFSQPNLEKLLQVAKLTQEQVDNADRLAPAEFPSHLKSKAHPISYDRYLAVAPGVVLIRAPGHTPGSQIVYVKQADGRETFFIGDVAWHQRNIDLVRERARLVTWWFLKEDRDSVMLQLAALKKLKADNPSVEIMPGHDEAVLEQLLASGMIQRGFK